MEKLTLFLLVLTETFIGFEVMEIEEIRKELNQLLENIVSHSSRYSDERPIPSLEISFILAKVNRMQERMAVLKHLLQEKENSAKYAKNLKINTNKNEPATEERVIETAPIEIEPAAAPIIETSPQPEELSQAPTETVPTPDFVQQVPVSKLIDALTLNDRYLYANELFNKDMNAFNELVKSIDDSGSLAAAKLFLTPLGLDVENPHVISFHELIEGRFS